MRAAADIFEPHDLMMVLVPLSDTSELFLPTSDQAYAICRAVDSRQDDPGVIPAGDIYGDGAPTGIVINEGDALGAKWRGAIYRGQSK